MKTRRRDVEVGVVRGSGGGRKREREKEREREREREREICILGTFCISQTTVCWFGHFEGLH